MLVINPGRVQWGAIVLDNVTRVSVDRFARRSVVEWSDDGRFPTFADVPEQRVEINITQELTREELSGPKPGDSATLVVHTSPAASDAQRKKLTVNAVVLGVTHQVSANGFASRRMRLVAVAAEGSVDPVSVG
ncbi:MAG: hypothetical protein SFZ23_13255 [Planctomycetota bacterium]|nr:hypothetical protein [Planctomycetota bacterium]